MSPLTFRLPEEPPAIAPDPVAAVRRSGFTPHHVLMVGGGVLRGLGLRNHNLGLPGHVADQLAARTGRGVDLDVIVENDPTTPRALEALRGLRLRRYDAVLVFLDNEAARASGRPERWRRQIERLCDVLRDECAADTAIVIYDAPYTSAGGLGLASRRVRSTVERMTAEAASASFLFGVAFDALPSEGARLSMGLIPSATTYTIWADAVVSRVHPRLRVLEARTTPDTPRAFRGRPDPERPRMRALAQMRLRPDERDGVLEYIVTQAKTTFRADAAHLNIIDGDLQWAQASTDAEPPTLPRDLAFCDQTIRSDGLTLVNDAKRDPRFRTNPLTDGGAPIRFYAGYPIHSWDGYRIGALCILGSSPRSMLASELLPLQDFAGRVEQELWTMALRGRPAYQPA